MNELAKLIRHPFYSLQLIFIVLIAQFDFRGIKYHAKLELKQVLKSNFGGLKRSGLVKTIMGVLSSVWFLGFVLPIVILFILKQEGLAPLLSPPSYEETTATFKLLIPIPLALIGLIIPFVTLSLGIVHSRVGHGAISHSLKGSRMPRLVYYSVSVLGLIIIFFTFTHLGPSIFGIEFTYRVLLQYGWSALFFCSWLIAILLILTVSSIRAVVSSFSPEKVIQNMRDIMVSESMKSLRKEMQNNLAISHMKTKLAGTIFSVSYFQPTTGLLVLAPKECVVRNVSLWGILKLNSLIKKIPNTNLYIELLRPFAAVDIRNRQIASITGAIPPEIHRSLLIAAIRSSYSLKKRQKQ